MVFDLFGSIFRLWIIPGRIRVRFSVHLKRIIRCFTFPWAGSVFGRIFKVCFIDRFSREVMVIFYYYSVFTFCEDLK